MPRNIERDKREADRRKNQLIEAGFRLFSQNGIETVSLQKVADAANVSPATMYKYFLTKEKLLIAISAKVWDEVWQEALGDPGTNHFEHFTAYQGIEFYADRMIALYKNRPEVLRFSGEYSYYLQAHSPRYVVLFFTVQQQACIQIASTIYTQARLRTSLFCFLLYQLSLWWVKYRAQPEAINP